MVFYSLDILRRSGVTNGAVLAAAIHSIGTVINVVANIATARVNRRPQLISSCLGCGVALAGFAAAAYLKVRTCYNQQDVKTSSSNTYNLRVSQSSIF